MSDELFARYGYLLSPRRNQSLRQRFSMFRVVSIERTNDSHAPILPEFVEDRSRSLRSAFGPESGQAGHRCGANRSAGVSSPWRQSRLAASRGGGFREALAEQVQTLTMANAREASIPDLLRTFRASEPGVNGAA